MADPEKRPFPTISSPSARSESSDIARPQVEGYEILELIDTGGMGCVWKAQQQGTHRRVALKVIGAQYFEAERARARFAREVELAARLEHPGIARIYDSGLHRGIYYYAMEFVGGRHLDTYVKQERLDQQEILKLFGNVCLAVQYAHRRSVIHRDLKPSNILVTSDGQPHILDFGLAKDLLMATGSRTVSLGGEVLGTPAYMSPEQAAGRLDDVDTRTDVYSLTVMLYCLLTGAWPYDVTGSYYEVLKNVQEQEPQRPSRLIAGFDADLEAILLKGLAKNAEERYLSVAELARDVRNKLENRPVGARPVGVVYLAKKFIMRHRLASAVMALLLVIVMSTAFINSYSVRKMRQLNRQLEMNRDQSERQYAQVLDVLYQGAFPLFWAYWQGDMAVPPQVLFCLPEESRERKAVQFLLDRRPLSQRQNEIQADLLGPDRSFWNFVLGEGHFKQGNWQEAAAAYRQCRVPAMPTDAGTGWFLNIAEVRLKELQQ